MPKLDQTQASAVAPHRRFLWSARVLLSISSAILSKHFQLFAAGTTAPDIAMRDHFDRGFTSQHSLRAISLALRLDQHNQYLYLLIY
jgi:hypothetical protein